MPAITFDGPELLITIGHDGPITTVPAIDLYSRWKDWVMLGNAQFFPAFGDTIGGDDFGGGVQLTGYFFLRNDLGWRIVAADFDYEIRIVGDLYPVDPLTPSFNVTIGHSTQFILQRSSATNVVQSGAAQDVSAALEVINVGVQKASRLIPHSTEI